MLGRRVGGEGSMKQLGADRDLPEGGSRSAVVMQAAGLEDVTRHDLRATRASWVARSHGIMAVAKRLGHFNANVTTRHYARVVDDRDAEIAASFQPITQNLGARGGPKRAQETQPATSTRAPQAADLRFRSCPRQESNLRHRV